MICSAIIYFADNEQVTKFVDPIMSIVSGITLLVLSYPYSKYVQQIFKRKPNKKIQFQFQMALKSANNSVFRIKQKGRAREKER